jgi:hypothetical protein
MITMTEKKIQVGERGGLSALLIHNINTETRRMQKSLDFSHEIMEKRDKR